MPGAKINWDEVFERFTENKILKASYSEIARQLGVSTPAVEKQFKKRGVIDPRKAKSSLNKKGLKFKNGLNLNQQKEKLYPAGNTNALKHGLYAEVFWTKRGKQIYQQLVKTGDFLNPLDEVYLLKSKIASGEISKAKDVMNALDIMSRLYDKAIMLARNEIERERLTHEKTRVDIAREKLELERQKLKGPDKDTEEVHKDFIKSIVEEVEPEELYSDEEEQGV